MKIINLEGDKIKACFCFTVGLNEISVSTIFNKDLPDIAIFEGDKLVKGKLPDILAAITWVAAFGARD